jgi:hypothetical protein
MALLAPGSPSRKGDGRLTGSLSLSAIAIPRRAELPPPHID